MLTVCQNWTWCSPTTWCPNGMQWFIIGNNETGYVCIVTLHIAGKYPHIQHIQAANSRLQRNATRELWVVAMCIWWPFWVVQHLPCLHNDFVLLWIKTHVYTQLYFLYIIHTLYIFVAFMISVWRWSICPSTHQPETNSCPMPFCEVYLYKFGVYRDVVVNHIVLLFSPHGRSSQFSHQILALPS